MKRIIMMVFRNILLVPYTWIKLCYRAGHVDKYTEEDLYKYIRWIDYHANRGGNVNIEVHGAENLPEEDGFIFFPNHQGLYDVLAIIEAFPRPFSVVAKKDLADIPFLKQIFACMRAYMIDRDDVKQAMQVIIEVSKQVKEGRNYLIFAEGTRSKNGNQVGTFKGGSFKAATKAKCPIVPVALIDSFKPFDTNTTKPVTVQVYFLKPLEYEDYKGMKTTEIAKLVQESIQATINANIESSQDVDMREKTAV
ncbi:MAG: 1-acyl-sn-glycerol-3-phosphate acyltransferase [Clostridiales bacterium]|nr:1-acyl-sn-glycerol-3-phosphate acyltransferase [Clostridiales bacterium]